MSQPLPPEIIDPLLLMSIGTLLLGQAPWNRDRNIFSAAGLGLFGLFWALRVPEFLSVGDVVDAAFSLLALPFFLRLAMELVKNAGENGGGGKGEHATNISAGLEMLVGAVAFGSLLYFLFAKIPLLSGYAIKMVADQTAFLASITGGPYTIGALDYTDSIWYSPGFYPGSGVTSPILRPDGSEVVRIEFACTGVQSIIVFAMPIIFTKRAGWREKKTALVATSPTIYILNLIRNWSIIYMVDSLGYTPEFAHNVVGKTGSLVAMVLLAVLVFRIVPGILDDLTDIYHLFVPPKNRGKSSS